MKPILTTTVNGIACELRRDADAFRWYSDEGADMEVSGETVAAAAFGLIATYGVDDPDALLDAMWKAE